MRNPRAPSDPWPPCTCQDCAESHGGPVGLSWLETAGIIGGLMLATGMIGYVLVRWPFTIVSALVGGVILGVICWVAFRCGYSKGWIDCKFFLEGRK